MFGLYEVWGSIHVHTVSTFDRFTAGLEISSVSEVGLFVASIWSFVLCFKILGPKNWDHFCFSLDIGVGFMDMMEKDYLM